MKQGLRFHEISLYHTCGVSLIYDYFPADYHVDKLPNYNNTTSGCGWIIAGFVDSYACKEMYRKMRKKYKLIYQSTVRYNRNSGNDFFSCVFDCKPGKK